MAREKKAEESSTPFGLLILLALWLSLGAAPLLFGWSDVGLAFGMTGQPGTATVQKCVSYGAGKNSRTDCRGLFTPDDPGLPPSQVKLPPESDEGETFRARLDTGEGWARPSGTAGRLTALALPAFGLLVLIPVPLALFFLLKGSAPGRLFVSLTAATAVAMAALLVTGLIAAV